MKLISNDEYLAHHGIKGQKWGVRRYRNEDGSLTELGKKRISKDTRRLKNAQDRVAKRAKAVEYRTRNFERASNRPRWLMSPEVMANKKSALSKAQKKYSVSLKNADRLYKKLEKRYSEKNLSDLEPSLISRGEDVRQRLALDVSLRSISAISK